VIVGTAVLMQRNLKMESAARSASQQAKLEGDTLYEVAPLNDNQTVGRVDQNEESKSDQLSAKKGATTREDAVELKRSLALPSTLAKSVEPRNGPPLFQRSRTNGWSLVLELVQPRALRPRANRPNCATSRQQNETRLTWLPPRLLRRLMRQ